MGSTRQAGKKGCGSDLGHENLMGISRHYADNLMGNLADKMIDACILPRQIEPTQDPPHLTKTIPPTTYHWITHCHNPVPSCLRSEAHFSMMECHTPSNSYKHKQRIRACHLARRSSGCFYDTHGGSTALDSVAPFERGEIILGQKVGSGSFSNVYEIIAFDLRADQSSVYTKEQVMLREATVKSAKNGAKYVMKSLKENLEDSNDSNLFLDAAQDIAHEAKMLASLSHPNIISLHGLNADRCDAFLSGASAFFIILERMDCILADKLDIWAKEKNSFNPPKPLRTLRSIFKSGSSSGSVSSSSSSSSSSREADQIRKDEKGTTSNRLRVAISIASVLDYLHSRDVIFRDLKPDNIGVDQHGNIKCFDFGFSRFMPQHSDFQDDVHEMSIAGTPRYTAPEVIFEEPYNLKADVYSFAVILWELMCLQRPFAKYKYKNEFDEAILRGETLGLNRKWPLPVQDTIQRSLSRDLKERPTMSEIYKALSECIPNRVKYCDMDSTSIRLSSSQNQIIRNSFVFPAPCRRKFRVFSSSGGRLSPLQSCKNTIAFLKAKQSAPFIQNRI